jgi:hypothetical protein
VTLAFGLLPAALLLAAAGAPVGRTALFALAVVCGVTATLRPVSGRFAMPDGLLSLDESRSWEKIAVGEDHRQRCGPHRRMARGAVGN